MLVKVVVVVISVAVLVVGYPVYFVISRQNRRTYQQAMCRSRTRRAGGGRRNPAERTTPMSVEGPGSRPPPRRTLILAEDELSLFWRIPAAAAREVIQDWARTLDVAAVEIAALVIEEVRNHRRWADSATSWRDDVSTIGTDTLPVEPDDHEER